MISDEQADKFVKALHEKTQRDQEPKTIILKKDSRGFSGGEFDDLSGAACQISKSSLATDDAIWLGMRARNVNDGREAILALMELNKQMVAALLPLLTEFAETGELSNLNTDAACPSCGEWWKAEHHRKTKFCPFCGIDLDSYATLEPAPECEHVKCRTCEGVYGIPFFDWWLTCNEGRCPYCGTLHKHEGES